MYPTQALHRAVQQHPDAPAVLGPAGTRTQRELLDRVATFAGALRGRTVVLVGGTPAGPDTVGHEDILADAVAEDDQRRGGADLAVHVKQHIAGYKAPRSVDVVAALPTTAAGKIRTTELRARHLASRQG
jgi:hypothetical protein